jgi:hypothetical protein
MEQCGAVVGLKLGIVERRNEAAVPYLAADHDPGAVAESAGYVSAAEPRGLDFPTVVAKVGGRPLDAPPERLLDSHADHLETGARDFAFADAVQLRRRAQFAQIVVPPGEVEQQIADGSDAQTGTHPPQNRGPR